jgi:hypothetical protein
MADSYITHYIEKLSVDYDVNEILLTSETPFIYKVFQIKPKKMFAQKFLIAFSDYIQPDFTKLLDELEKVNEQQNRDKPTPCLLFVPSVTFPENLTFFNGIVFVHLAVFGKDSKQLVYDKNFHYFGAKPIQNAINLFESIL